MGYLCYKLCLLLRRIQFPLKYLINAQMKYSKTYKPKQKKKNIQNVR